MVPRLKGGGSAWAYCFHDLARPAQAVIPQSATMAAANGPSSRLGMLPATGVSHSRTPRSCLINIPRLLFPLATPFCRSLSGMTCERHRGGDGERGMEAAGS
jgi:hypothetical protein